MSSSGALRSAPFVASLRHELSLRNRIYAEQLGLAMCESFGQPPAICYLAAQDGRTHGNFLPESYQAILKNENWRRRLTKAHTQAKSSLPRRDIPWRELDSSNSSDALLMNIFCFPGALKEPKVISLLGTEPVAVPEFGVRARVPLTNGRTDGTEVDMRLGDLLVEAKLTESDFQRREVAVVEAYRDFHEVFDKRILSREKNQYLSYQLIRNVLAAHANRCTFCVMADARRPDLLEAWYSVMRAVRIVGLRPRCKMITWQELAAVVPPKLRGFLKNKYGIVSGASSASRDQLQSALSHDESTSIR
jgi:restriction endonuclease-like protein